MFFTTARLAVVAALALATSSVTAQAANNDPNGKKFFITAPSCDSYQCHHKIKQGGKMHINWLNPTKGNVNILLEPNEGTKGLKTHTIAKNISAHHSKATCQKYGQKSCGAYVWTVPADLKTGLYSVDIHSLSDKKVHGYSDIVQVDQASTTTPPAAADKTETKRVKSTMKKPTMQKKPIKKTHEKSSSKSTSKSSTAKSTEKDPAPSKTTKKGDTDSTKKTAEKKESSTKKAAGKDESSAKKAAGKKESSTKKAAGKKESSAKKAAGKKESSAKKAAGKKESEAKKAAAKKAKEAKKAAAKKGKDAKKAASSMPPTTN